jgi:hypothetical protein
LEKQRVYGIHAYFHQKAVFLSEVWRLFALNVVEGPAVVFPLVSGHELTAPANLPFWDALCIRARFQSCGKTHPNNLIPHVRGVSRVQTSSIDNPALAFTNLKETQKILPPFCRQLPSISAQSIQSPAQRSYCLPKTGDNPFIFLRLQITPLLCDR